MSRALRHMQFVDRESQLPVRVFLGGQVKIEFF